MIPAFLVVGLARFIAAPGVRWLGCRPEPTQRIYFANHTSNLDALVLWTALPAALREKTRPVAAHDYWTSSAIRLHLATDVFQAVLIERKKVTASNNPLELLLAALANGASLIIFPEGGRQPGPEPGPFKSGLYHLGKKRPDVELVPVYIDNMNRILPKGEIIPVPLVSCLTFGTPIRVGDAEGKQEFLERARKAVLDLRNP